MSFLLNCPNCGLRDSTEFRYGGELLPPAPPGAVAPDSNLAGNQRERWYHRLGCRRWLMAERNVQTNLVVQTRWLEEESQ